MRPNPFYDESLEQNCRDYMLLGMRLWMAFMEKHPNEVPADKMSSVFQVLELIEEDAEALSTRDIATAYQAFIDTFHDHPETLAKIHKVPILFLVPEIP